MKQRTYLLILVVAAVLSLLVATALAAGSEGFAPDSSADSDSSAAANDLTVQSDVSELESGPDDSAESVPDERAGAEDEKEPSDGEEPETAIPEYIPDPVGTISFQNMAPRMREGNLNVLYLEENIQYIRSFDYDKMKEDLRKRLNNIASQQWEMTTASSSLGPMGSLVTAAPLQSLQSAYNSMRQQFDDLKDGKIQKNGNDSIRQLKNTQNQIIMTGESLYIALLDMENTDQSLDRQLAALDRQLEELELRYELGQISAQTLGQAKAGRTSLVSGQQTLESNIKTYKMRLELFIGAELTGNIRLASLPKVTDKELNAMDLEADLKAAKEASYSLYEAKRTLDDEEEEFKDKGREYNYSEKKYQYVQAQHQWQAAQYNYNATVQNFEIGLRSLYLQVKDNRQVLEAAEAALSMERSNYATAQLKHTQGNLSQSALLDAGDKVKQAQESVDSASITLFSSYHSYRWAVDYGILN